jgi:NADPH:quinone reductase-like Zn-dependent oxidoreductase
MPMAKTMQAIRLSEPGNIDRLVLTDLPAPQPAPGWVRKREGVRRE